MQPTLIETPAIQWLVLFSCAVLVGTSVVSLAVTRGRSEMVAATGAFQACSWISFATARCTSSAASGDRKRSPRRRDAVQAPQSSTPAARHLRAVPRGR